MTAAKFYPGVTGGQVSHSISIMALCARLLAHPNRKLQEWVLNRTVPAFLDHRIPTALSDAQSCYISELYDLYNQAMGAYPALLEALTTHLRTGEAISDAFIPNFG